MSYVSYGNDTLATRKKVRFYNRESSAETLYEGQPLCYIFDSTTNEMGINKQTGAEGSTTAESYHNEGKLVQVEKPYSDNLLHFAGVVASGSWCGKSIAATSWVDIDVFIPNGAVVLVRADVECTVGRTILALESDSQALTQSLGATQGRPVAIAMETNATLDSTAGLIMARLCPNEFIYQDHTGDALIACVGADVGDVVVNRINVTSAQTDDRFTAFEIKAEMTGTGSSMSGGCGFGLALYTETNISGILSDSQNAGVSHWTNLNAGADLTSQYFAMEIGIYESGADLSGCGFLAPLCLRMQIDGTNGPTAKRQYQMYLRSEGGGSDPDGLFAAYTTKSIGMVGKSSAAVSHVIPIEIEHSSGAGTYYIMVSDAA